MKLSLKTTCVLLIFALLASCVAATENKDIPTKEEITDFIAGIPVSDNYIITVFDAVKDKHPAWKCDTWVDKNDNQILSLYYVDPDSAKGYGSIYFNKLGKEISVLGVDVVLVNSYVGEAVSEEIKEEVKGTEEKETVTETETEEELRKQIEEELRKQIEEEERNKKELIEKQQQEELRKQNEEEERNKKELIEKQQQEEPTKEGESEVSSASVNLYGEKTEVVKGEDILLKLSAVNLITNPTMHVQVIIIPSSGMSVTSSEYSMAGAGQYTAAYSLEPGEAKNIGVSIKSNQVGDFNVKGRVIYYFGGNKKDAEDKTLDLSIQVKESDPQPTPDQTPTPTPIPTPTPFIPGLGLASLLFILMTAFILRRN